MRGIRFSEAEIDAIPGGNICRVHFLYQSDYKVKPDLLIVEATGVAQPGDIFTSSSPYLLLVYSILPGVFSPYFDPLRISVTYGGFRGDYETRVHEPERDPVGDF